MRSIKTTTQVARDEKYLKFLMALYLKISKGYTRISISGMCVEHGVDSVIVQALLEIGWISKMANTPQYYWRGPLPIDSMAEQIQIKISAIKVVKQTNQRAKEIPVNSNGKALVPIIPSEKTKVLKGAIPRYLDFLEFIYLHTAEKPCRLQVADILAAKKIGSSVQGVIQRLNLIKKERDFAYEGQGRKFLWSWIGAVPDLAMAELVLKTNNQEIVASTTVDKQKNNKEEKHAAIPEKFRHLLNKRETVILPPPENFSKQITITGTSNVPDKERALKREIALKLLDLGEYERANKMLDELL